MSLSVHQIAVGGYDDNFAYLIEEVDSKQCLIVDPSGDLELILRTIEELDLSPIGTLITHTHHDHIDQLAELLRSYTIPIYVHERGLEAIVSSGPIKSLQDGDALVLGNHTIDVIYTPGHIDDAICFYIKKEHTADGVPKLISGDTLFVEGCGRTTETRVKDLYESLQELKALPEDTEVYPGHDYGSMPHSTITHEKTHNKYFLAKDFNEFKKIRLG